MPQRNGLTDEIHRLGEVPKEFDQSEGFLRVITVPDGIDRITYDEAIDLGCKLVTESLKSRDKRRCAEARRGLGILNYLVFTFHGGHEYLILARHPNNAAMVPDALAAYLDNANAVRAMVPALGIAVDNGELHELRDHLSFVIQFRQEQQGMIDGYERLQRLLENKVYDHLSRVYELAHGSITANLTLRDKLLPFTELFTKSAEEAQESKKENKKVKKDTVEVVKKALSAAQKKAQTGTQPAEPPVPPPTPPKLSFDDLELEDLRSPNNRTRGKGRT